MKFVILSSCQLPSCGVRGPILTPRYYDIHLILKWLAAGIDVREVMDDGSYRKLEFNDERIMKELDEELERRRIEGLRQVKLVEEEPIKITPKKVNVYPPEPVKPIKQTKKEKPVVKEVKEEIKVEEKKKPEFEVDNLEPMD